MITDNYTCIHSHILWGVDDGPSSIDESLKMLGIAHHEGVRTMIVTPHYGAENGYAPSAGRVRANFSELQGQAKIEFPDMRLCLGSELYCAPGKVLERVERGQAFPLAGSKYLLLEFLEWGGKYETAEYITRAMVDIARAKWFPILAHAQRYRAFEGKQALYRAMVGGGVYLQINAYDLADHPDGWVKENTRWIAGNMLAHFIGTDAHRVSHRQPVMRSGVEYLYAHCDEEYVDALVYGNAEKLITGEQVPLSAGS